MSDPIRDLLSYDALAEAERVTGESYKDDASTMRLGFGLHLMHASHKERALVEADDSWFSMPLAETLGLHERLGFSEIVRTPFADDEGRPETHHILWHADGLLATVESYNQTHRNMSKVYYNFEFLSTDDYWSYTSSGHFLSDGWENGRRVWVGDHDTREGLRNTIDRFRSVGRFLPAWEERPFLWLLTYMDSRVEGYDYEAINAARIAEFPADVRAAIGAEVSR